HAQERVHHQTIQQAKVTDTLRHRGARQAVEEAVVEASRRPLEPSLRAANYHAIDDVVAFAPQGDELLEHLGWVLKVGVHDHNGVTAGQVDPGGECDLVAEVA